MKIIKFYAVPFLLLFGAETWYIKLIQEAHMRLLDEPGARGDIVALGFIWGVALPLVLGSMALVAYAAGWLLGGAPGGESPTEKGSRWGKRVAQGCATLGGFNILLALLSLVLQYQQDQGIIPMIILMIMGIILSFLALERGKREFSRAMPWIFGASLTLLIGEGISPGLLHNAAKFRRDPILAESDALSEDIARRQARQDAVLVVKKMRSCAMMAQDLLKEDGAKDCSISKEQFQGWKSYLEGERKKRLLPDLFSGKDAGEERARERPKRKAVNVAGCHVDKKVSGDEITISFPNCYSGLWETDLPEPFKWTCNFDKDVKIAWNFTFTEEGERARKPYHYSVLGEELPSTDEIFYPMDGIDPFALHMEVQGEKLELQWNVVIKNNDYVRNFWRNQRNSVTIRCSTML